jgi:hypothetical protein
MREVVWEERWRNLPDLPRLGEYIQIIVESEVSGDRRTLQGFVTKVFGLVISIDINCDRELIEYCWDVWRRGIAPEFVTTLRRAKTDA